ncbi:MAG TPA: insulinase family protein, partial [Gemmatimonadaceae bacterium]|nr:insulinase family protein [Gemmatimonadaceae bacterium]
PTDDRALLSGAVQVLHDWASGDITIDSAEVVAERGVVLGEWRSRLPDSTGRAIQESEMRAMLDPGSRYLARLPIGDTAQLASATVEPLRRFYRDWYRPDLMAVVAVGDFDADEMERTIRERFGAIAAPAKRREAPVAVPAVLATPRVNIVRSQRVAPMMQFVWREPEPSAGLDAALRRELVTYILHAELQQRLSGMHVERGSAPFIRASLGSGGVARPFPLRYLSVMALPDSLERAAAVALGEVERIAQHGIPGPALAHRKAILLRSLEAQALRADAMPSDFYASGYTDHYLTGRSSLASVGQQAERAKRLLAGVTGADLAAAARFWRDRDLRVLVRFPEFVSVSAPDERRVLALLDSVAQNRTEPLDANVVAAAPVLEREPVPGRVAEERHHERSGITEWTLSNGARVLLRPTPNEPDQVLIRAWSPGGFSLVPDSMFFGTGRMVARLMTALAGGAESGKGTVAEGRTADVLRAFSVDIGYGDESMTLAGSPRDLETIFQLMHRQFTAPRLDTARVRAWQGLGKYMSPGPSLHDQLDQMVARGNPRLLPVSTRLAELFQVDQAMALYGDRFGDASDFTFTIVGAVSRDEVRALVERYVASLPASGRMETPKDPRLRPFLSRQLNVIPEFEVPKASTLLAFNGQFAEEPAEYLAEREKLALLTSIVQERLRLRLREEMSATYGVAVQDMTYPLPREHYRVLFGFDAAPERRHEVTDELFAVLDEIRALIER